MMKKINKLIFIFIAFFSLSLSSCFLDDILPENVNPVVPPTPAPVVEDELKDTREWANNQLDTYISDYSIYFENDQNQIRTLISNAKENIKTAVSNSQLQSIVISTKNLIDSIKTIAEVQQDSQDLAEYKESQLSSVVSSYDESKYRNAQIEEINTIVNNLRIAVAGLSNKDDVLSACSEAKVLISKVKTDEQLIIEESLVDRFVSLYAINDFHGRVIEGSSDIGILKVGTYLKEKGKEDDTLLINSGDMFQGSIESNYNKGELLTKCMNDIEFDCFTLGNHEFDWDTSYIEANKNLCDPNTNYQTPFLGANIYHYENGRSTTHADELCDSYTIRTLGNGLKVGIIGVIGESQITSINANYVKNITFVDPTPIIKKISDELRVDKGCDVIVVDGHASAGQMADDNTSSYSNIYDRNGLTSISTISGKRYADVVLCAHSHQKEEYKINGVPFVQAGCNGQKVANIELIVKTDGTIECLSSSGDIDTNQIKSVSNIDTNLKTLYTLYKAETDKLGTEILVTSNTRLNAYVQSSSGTRNTDNTIPNIVCKAIGEYCVDNNVNVDFVMCNDARSNIYSVNVTYADLYQSLPFDSLIYVIKVKGQDIINEYGKNGGSFMNAIYCLNGNYISNTSYYFLATIDYLAVHTNTSRQLNYFKTQVGEPRILEKNYREITKDYLKTLGTIYSGDFSVSGTNSKYFTLSY